MVYFFLTIPLKFEFVHLSVRAKRKIFVRIPTNRVTLAGLLVAIGIIYGDIGTSPLYVFGAIIKGKVVTETLILGGLSCIIWTLTLQTTIKYVILTLRADNNGEGGMFSLFALVRRHGKWAVIPAMMGGRRCSVRRYHHPSYLGYLCH